MAKPTEADYREMLRNGGTMPPLPDDPPAHRNGHAANGKPKHRKPASIGRFQTMNAFIDQSARLVNTTAQAVWFVLFRETKSNTGTATIAYSQIGQMVGISDRAVARAVATLVTAGLVEITVQGGIGRNRRPSTFRVHGIPKQAPKRTPASSTANGAR